MKSLIFVKLLILQSIRHKFVRVLVFTSLATFSLIFQILSRTSQNWSVQAKVLISSRKTAIKMCDTCVNATVFSKHMYAFLYASVCLCLMTTCAIFYRLCLHRTIIFFAKPLLLARFFSFIVRSVYCFNLRSCWAKWFCLHLDNGTVKWQA